MIHLLAPPVLALVLGTAFLSVEYAGFDAFTPAAGPIGIGPISIGPICIGPIPIGPQGPVKIFDPLSLPKDTTAREPFLDPTALFSDQVYVVRPLDPEAEGSARNARFVGGEQALVSYLRGRVLQHIAPGIGWLKPPVLHFHVDATGAPTQVELVRTSGNADLDVALVRIFKEMPRWEAATDARGQSVPQAFHFVVGPGGC